MILSPLMSASPLIQAHAYFAFAALALGAAQFVLPKGDIAHRAMGWTWTLLMLGVVGTSFFIHTIRSWGPFSPIHLLSLLTLVAVPAAIYAARRRLLVAHRMAMMQIYGLALVLTGLFTLWPGRIMHKVVFGS